MNRSINSNSNLNNSAKKGILKSKHSKTDDFDSDQKGYN